MTTLLTDGCILQILALLAMEQPVTLSADDIRDEKVRVRNKFISDKTTQGATAVPQTCLLNLCDTAHCVMSALMSES